MLLVATLPDDTLSLWDGADGKSLKESRNLTPVARQRFSFAPDKRSFACAEGPDANGIHLAIWDELEGNEPFELPADQPLTLAAYVAGNNTVGRSIRAYVETVGIGEVLPDMPAYLDTDYHVPVPLEATYESTWATCPADMRYLVEHGKLPGE